MLLANIFSAVWFLFSSLDKTYIFTSIAIFLSSQPIAIPFSVSHENNTRKKRNDRKETTRKTTRTADTLSKHRIATTDQTHTV